MNSEEVGTFRGVVSISVSKSLTPGQCGISSATVAGGASEAERVKGTSREAFRGQACFESAVE